MPRNIVIFSDGTGQRGGLLFDERRSNIYKLYRATRCGPDSSINPAEQVTYYDPGIGTVPGGLGFFGAVGYKIYNLVSQATGLGLTRNIIHCYAAIIRMWRPGDRIFLFGFSRGAYTVRCISAVLAECGVPTHMKDGTALRRDDRTAKKIAAEAVKRVHQHVSSPNDKRYVPQRTALAARFRALYGSDQDGRSNAYPYFIGVFDTVAAVANTGSLILVLALALVSICLVSAALWLLTTWLFASSLSYVFWLGCVAVLSAAAAVVAYIVTHIKVAFGLEGYDWWQTMHFTDPRLKFLDLQLNPNVVWARHALAIDEHRADFDRVPWGSVKVFRETAPNEPDWLQQFWFAGNHSDIGGSYVENESRLSDTALQWMIEAAQKIPNGLKIDRCCNLIRRQMACSTMNAGDSYSALRERLIARFLLTPRSTPQFMSASRCQRSCSTTRCSRTVRKVCVNMKSSNSTMKPRPIPEVFRGKPKIFGQKNLDKLKRAGCGITQRKASWTGLKPPIYPRAVPNMPHTKSSPASAFGTSRTSGDVRLESAKWAKADIDQVAATNRDL